MRIFLSYANEQKHLAEPIAFSLRSSGHSVFLDKDDLPAGRSYDDQIYEAIRESDVLVFLISPASVSKGRYTLSELEIARRAWLHPANRVVPVLVEQTDLSLVPSFLKGVTILEPQGNLVADVRAAVESLHETHRAPAPAIQSSLQAAGLAALIFVLIIMAAVMVLYVMFGENYEAGYVERVLLVTLAVGLPICVVLWVWGPVRSWKVMLPMVTLFPLVFIGTGSDVNPMFAAFATQQIDSAALGLLSPADSQGGSSTKAPELNDQQKKTLEQIESANKLAKRYTATMGGAVMGLGLVVFLLAGAAMAAPALRSVPCWVSSVVLGSLSMGLFSFIAFELAGPDTSNNALGLIMMLDVTLWVAISGGLIGYWLARGRTRYRPA